MHRSTGGVIPLSEPGRATEPATDTAAVLRRLSETPGLSGYEHPIRSLVTELFQPLCDTIRVDALGNLIALKKGEGDGPRPKMLWAAHMDEIGFMVAKVEKGGFLRIASVGGIDVRNVLGEEVIVHGREELPGVIGAKPPHLTTEEERNRPVPIDELFVDVGLSEERARERVRPGDLVSLRRPFRALAGRRVTGKALDNRASVACLHHALEVLRGLRHRADVYAVATVQEEVGLRGAVTSAFGVMPDVAIAVDVGFGTMPGLKKKDTLDLGKGPGILFGANVHPRLHEQLVTVASRYNIPFQLEVAPGRTGTDAWAIQVTGEGIPTGLLSVPLRHMHSPAEVLDVADIEATGRLLAFHAASLTADDVDGWAPPLEGAAAGDEEGAL